ncbi:alanine racemase [Eggerthella sinensis]|uniref:alanine racemase n=1 Tax=Eggerthella sinensis TaxID=242230 RepID=UPI00248F3214|nr:alanine racemase [Eggerthella sinensis]
MTEQHPELVRPAWAEIDLAAVEANARAAKRLIGDACSLMAAVKADAYGHGAVRCAQAALAAGARSLGVHNESHIPAFLQDWSHLLYNFPSTIQHHGPLLTRYCHVSTVLHKD